MSAVSLKHWSREEFDRLVAAGILSPEERVELLEGDIVRMWPQSPAHSVTITNTEEALRAAFRTGFTVRVQMPFVGGHARAGRSLREARRSQAWPPTISSHDCWAQSQACVPGRRSRASRRPDGPRIMPVISPLELLRSFPHKHQLVVLAPESDALVG